MLNTRNHYDPFGKITPNRHGGENYRYGFNTQEKTDEIAGEGNHTTAKYWEYDPRVVKRWNQDPIQVVGVSPYVINGNNPIYFTDPNGDFKNKFGAWLYKKFHGLKGEIIENPNYKSGDSKNSKYFIDESYTTKSDDSQKGGDGTDGNPKILDGMVIKHVFGNNNKHVSEKDFFGKSMDFVSSHGGYWNDRLQNALDDYADLLKTSKRNIALNVSKITNIKPGVVFQSIKKSTKALTKVAGTAGKYIEGLNAGIIVYEIGSNTWDAHTVVNTGLMVGGFVAAGTVAAPVVLPAIAIYGAADYMFDISGKIDENVGRDSGIYKD